MSSSSVTRLTSLLTPQQNSQRDELMRNVISERSRESPDLQHALDQLEEFDTKHVLSFVLTSFGFPLELTRIVGSYVTTAVRQRGA